MDMSSIILDWPERIRELMLRLGVSTKSELSIKLGVSKSTITNWEAGKFSESTSKLLHCGVSVDWFLTGEGKTMRGNSKEESPSQNTDRALGFCLDELERLKAENARLADIKKKSGSG
ncbi:hypothetical protein LCGC14_0557530 [marine sediment metagenome]|uniref:HTH cro/C1-type domain-containing protein n=1 Tax=marine sediment metagenome TaxID=412755 RepID=A0A0F9S6P0_9ZZZZ